MAWAGPQNNDKYKLETCAMTQESCAGKNCDVARNKNGGQFL